MQGARNRVRVVLASSLTVLLVASLIVALPAGTALAAAFAVDTTSDANDSTLDGTCDDGSGNCTLRAAVEEANDTGAADSISLPSGTLALTIGGASEDAAATGDLDITADLSITGHADGSVIDGGGTLGDRILHVTNNATLTLTDVTISGGDGVNGAAVLVDGGATLIIDGVTINGNDATGAGGAVDSAGTVTATNSTIHNNDASGDGGGLNVTGGTATLTNVTVTGNTGDNGGNIAQSGGTVTLDHTIVANGTGTTSGADCTGSIGSSGYNVVSSTTGCTFSSTTGDVTDAGADLGVLADNGGPTSTRRLQATSPALDIGGSCSAVDQRNVTRGSTCDAGSFEAVQLVFATAAENHAETGSETVDVTLDGTDPNQEITATVNVTGGTATDTVDFSVSGTAISFPAGTSTPNTVTIDITDDDFDEGTSEDVQLTVESPSPTGTLLGSPAGYTLTIDDDDTAGVTITESSGTTDLDEAGGTDTYDVVLDSEPTDTVTIDLTPDADVNVDDPVGLQLIFPAAQWDTPQTVTLSAVDDGDIEFAHTGTVTHAATSSGDGDYDGIAVSGVTANITDNDLPVLDFDADVTHTEGDTGTLTYTFRVIITPTVPVAVTVDYSTEAAVTAPADIGTEVESISDMELTIPATDAFAEFDIDTTNDELEEVQERFRVRLTNPSNATIGDDLAIGFIDPDTDAAPVGNPDSFDVDEGGVLITSDATGVRANDTDADHATASLSTTIDTGPTADTGGFALAANGSFTYTHDGTDASPDTFTYDVTDGANTTGPVTATINVNNVAPVVTANASLFNIAENDTFTLDLTTYSDAGIDDTHSATIDWDDGSPIESCTGGPNCDVVSDGPGTGSGRVTGTHTYTDNGVYTVTVTVTDDEGGSHSDTVTVTVSNVDLPVSVVEVPGGATTGDEGTTTMEISATYSDPDLDDTHTATVDWGDGGPVESCTGPPNCELVSDGPGTGSGMVTGTHLYADDGSFTVVVSVSDGVDTGQGGVGFTIDNVDPTATINGPATRKEGRNATFTSGVSDPGADTFTYSWTVLRDGQAYDSDTTQNLVLFVDDNGDYEISLEITDDDGGVSNIAVKDLTVTNVDPTVELLHDGSPLGDIENLGDEGDKVTLTADVTEPSPVDDLTYSWSLLHLGNVIKTGSNPNFNFTAPDDGSFFVTLDVDDDDNSDPGTGTDQLLAQFDNLKPVIKAFDTDGTPAVGVKTSLKTVFSDAGPDDTHELTIDWGDGTVDVVGNVTSPKTRNHTFGSAGVRTGRVCVEDDDGAKRCRKLYFSVGGVASLGSDFNGDGFEDIVAGVPGEDSGAGAVHVIYGSGPGPSSTGNQLLRQGASGLPGVSQADDEFGAAFASGDFDGDGFDDLAVGAPGENIGGSADTGNLTVLYGSGSGLKRSTAKVFHQNSSGVLESNETGDHFAAALASGDFNNDGFADLIVGVPGENLGGTVNPGRIAVLFGSPSGITAANDESWHQNTAKIKNSNSANDEFGASLTSGDFDGDGDEDVAVGLPGQKIGGDATAGAVIVINGRSSGLTANGNAIWHQDRIKNAAEPGDRFGAVLTGGDFDGDGFIDLAAGVPNEGISGVSKAGAVAVIYGGANGLAAGGNQIWHLDSSGIAGAIGQDDLFGTAVASGDIDQDGFDDLGIGTPNSDIKGKANAGEVAVIYGSGGGLSSGGSERWHEEIAKVKGVARVGDGFGSALTILQVDNDGAVDYPDLVIGIPGQNIGGANDAGALLYMRGASSGVTKTKEKVFHQNVTGMNNTAEALDRFAAVL